MLMKPLFDEIRGSLFGGKLIATQVSGIERLIDAGAKETFTHAALPAAWATGFSVEAVAVSYRVSAGQNSGVVTKDLQRIGGTDYVGTSLGNNAQITPVQKVYNQSPATSADWTMSEAASEFGVIVEAAA